MRQALSIAFALAPFGVVFGVACADAGLSWLDAAGFSALTFAGSSQFAAVDVLGDGGTAVAAIGAGLLLNIRSLAFGVLLAPSLDGPRWKRALLSQLVIDESTAVATDAGRSRAGGASGSSPAASPCSQCGTSPPSSASHWLPSATTSSPTGASTPPHPPHSSPCCGPVSSDRGAADSVRIALLGGAVAALAIPFTPPGVPILLAGLGVLAVRR